MDITPQTAPMSKQLQRRPDHADSLEPGYRFCIINSDQLVVNYLKQKVETGKNPKSRLYEVNNIYDRNPKELTDRLQSCEDKWYFLTPREQTYPNAKQPSRKTKEASWRTTQKYSTVYDDIRGRVAIGRKRSLAYYDANEEKTEWLMHEYTTNHPDLAIGTKGRNKLSDWVLCKIYKKEKNRVDNNTDHAQEVQNTRNGELNNRNDDETSPIRRRLSVNQESNIQPKDQDIQIQDAKDHKSVLTEAIGSISSLIIVSVVILYWPILMS